MSQEDGWSGPYASTACAGMREVGQLQALRLTLGAKLPEPCHVHIGEKSRPLNKHTESVRTKFVTRTASQAHGSSSSESAFIREADLVIYNDV